MFNRKLLEEINSLRTNPSGYAKKIEKLKSHFEGDIYKLEDGTKIKTQEGGAAYDEAINFLKSAEAVGKLTSSKGLTRIAEELLENIQRTDPDNLDSIDMNQIVEKYGDYSGEGDAVLSVYMNSPVEKLSATDMINNARGYLQVQQKENDLDYNYTVKVDQFELFISISNNGVTGLNARIDKQELI